MADVTLNDALNDFENLNESDKEYFLDLAAKQLAELKRKKLFDTVQEAEKNYKAGNTKSGSVIDLIRDLEND